MAYPQLFQRHIQCAPKSGWNTIKFLRGKLKMKVCSRSKSYMANSKINEYSLDWDDENVEIMNFVSRFTHRWKFEIILLSIYVRYGYYCCYKAKHQTILHIRTKRVSCPFLMCSGGGGCGSLSTFIVHLTHFTFINKP